MRVIESWIRASSVTLPPWVSQKAVSASKAGTSPWREFSTSRTIQGLGQASSSATLIPDMEAT